MSDKQKSQLPLANWLILIVITAIVAAIALYPMFKDGDQKKAATEQEKAVYRVLKNSKSAYSVPLPEALHIGFTLEDKIWVAQKCAADSDILRLVSKNSVPGLRISQGEITELAIKYLAKQPIEVLALFDTRVSDKLLAQIKTLKQLKVLEITSNYQFTKTALNNLTGPPDLQKLNLSNTSCTDSNLNCLAKAYPNLIGLQLRNCPKVSDQSAKSIAKFKKLLTLDVRGTNMGTASLLEIARLTTIVRLYLGGDGITDNTINAIKGMKLKSLEINEAPITDRCLKDIAAIKTLKNIEISKCNKISAKAIASLKQSRPELLVDYRGKHLNPEKRKAKGLSEKEIIELLGKERPGPKKSR